MKKILSFIFLAALLLSLAVAPSAAQTQYDPVLKIGIKYGTSAMPAAKLTNLAGQADGYDLGYFDSNRDFISVFSTSERKAAVLKNAPMWVDAAETYYDTKPSSYNFSIGCYHLEVEKTYSSLESAQDAVDYINGLGFKAFPSFISGEYKVRVGEHLEKSLASDAYEQLAAATGLEYKVVGGSSTGYTFTVLGTDKILFSFDMGKTPLGVVPHSNDTWFSGITYNGGFEYNRVTGGNITVINVITMNDYIKGVLPSEMWSSWPLEALKTQAVCAKCYTINTMNKHKSLGFDLCNTTDCQAYNGTRGRTDHTDRAVDETYGIYATYNGKIVQTYYHSSSGGYTDDVANIWGGHIPYLVGVEDKYLVQKYPYSFSISLDQVTQVLQAKGKTTRKITDVYVSRFSQYGNAIELAAVESNGNVLRFSGGDARTILNSTLTPDNVKINSHRYTISGGTSLFINDEKLNKTLNSIYAIGANGVVDQISVDKNNLKAMTKDGVKDVKLESDNSGVYTVIGYGSGHNIGMSQWGAHAMAELGFTFDEIISFYFTGVKVEQVSGY